MSATLPELKGPPQLFFRHFVENIENSAYRERFLLYIKFLALGHWATRFNAGQLGQEPTRYAGGMVVDFFSDPNAPFFYEHVVEPRLRQNLAELKWLLELPKRYPHISGLIAFRTIFQCYLDLLYTFEEMAGKLTLQNYGSLPKTDDPRYWKVQRESFHAVGLDLHGEEMFTYIFKGDPYAFFDEMVRVKHPPLG